MPVPIKYVPDFQRDKNLNIDYSILFTHPVSQKKTIIASNQDASILFELWKKGEKIEEDTIKISDSNIATKDIIRLKTLGFLTGDTNVVKFTKKGKIVITTMALGEPNQFEKNKQDKSYTEILASMNKKGKKGFRIASSDPKFSVHTNNNLNLRDLWKSTQK